MSRSAQSTDVSSEKSVKEMEIKRLKSLVQRYRVLVNRLVADGETYTDNIDYPFCSGLAGYQSANEREDETIKHARLCPTRQATRLAPETI